MKFERISVVSYKGYKDTGFIEMSPNWNVVVGRNNSGKSAFVEAFRLGALAPKPHRSLDLARGQNPPPSQIFVDVHVPANQLDIFLRNGGTIIFAMPDHFARNPEIYAENIMNNGVSVSMLAKPENNQVVAARKRAVKINGSEDRALVVNLSYSPKGDLQIGSHQASDDTIWSHVSNALDNDVYVFEAKRFGRGTCTHSVATKLATDAGNLAAVLASLGMNPARLAEFESHVKSIFPSIKAVRSGPGGEGLEVRLWTVDPETQREDLTVSLDESGTGVGQVLSILYVAINNPPGVVVIDEPNSFLHPGAAKKLIEILKGYSQHQYVVSTHSPEIMSILPEANILIVKNEVGISSITPVDNSDAMYKRSMLEEVGASLSDVFGSERVLWVEGPTERDCFHLIYANEFGRKPIEFTVVPMRATGDFEGRRADSDAIIDIYETISQGGALLPVTMGFAFDLELRTPSEEEDLKRRLRDLAHILPRRMIENYFLSSDAISHLLAVRSVDIEPDKSIEDSLVSSLAAPKILPEGGPADLSDPRCLKVVDGARLLRHAISDVTNARYDYRKVQDGPEILSWLLENRRQDVVELVEFAMRSMTDGG